MKLKNLSIYELNALASEIRKEILNVVSKNGGHLSSNLGVVELTLGMHAVFDSKIDPFIFDVSHQCYTHKILTDRGGELFATLRKFAGISGYTNPNESKDDYFVAGHSSTSISLAVGAAKAIFLKQESRIPVVLIGDGALSGGEAYEALNELGDRKYPCVIILNDNEMSIAKPVGALSKFISQAMAGPFYQKFKARVNEFLKYMPDSAAYMAKRLEEGIRLITPGMFFEELGLEYIGPINGHDMGEIISTKKEKSIIKNAFYSFFKSFISLLFPLITFPYASRILLPEGIGKVNYANSIVTYFIIIAELGIGKYATREASKIKNDKSLLSKFTKEMILLSLIATIFSYLLFLIALFLIPSFSTYRPLLFVLSGKIFFACIGIDWLYSSLEEFKYTSIRSIIFQFVSLAFLFIFVKSKDDYIQYAIFGMIGAIGTNVCNIIHSLKFIDYKTKTKIELKKHLKNILPFLGMTLIPGFYEILDSFMLGFLTNDTQCGLYSASIKINRMTVEVLTAICAVFLPRLSLYYKENSIEKFNSLVIKGYNFIFTLSLPMMIGLFMLSEPLVLLFCGPDFYDAIIPMKILSFVLIFISLSNLLGSQILPSINKEKFSMISFILAACTNIILNLIFIPKYGAIGAAIGTVFAEFICLFVQFIYLRKMFFNKLILINSFQTIFSSILMLAVLFILQNFVNNNLLLIILSVIVGITVYFTMMILLKNKITLELVSKIQKK